MDTGGWIKADPGQSETESRRRTQTFKEEQMTDQTQERQLVVFTLGSEQYALPIQRVHEIIRYVTPRAVASRQDWVRGVINLRGRIIPIYDLAAHLGIHTTADAGSRIVILDTGSETLGVIVDGVDEVLTVSEEQLERVPTADTAAIDSIAKLGERLVVLLKPELLFGTGELLAA
jgi:purine-binding chemotaxis protein CheW